jgi:hypothetical protein
VTAADEARAALALQVGVEPALRSFEAAMGTRLRTASLHLDARDRERFDELLDFVARLESTSAARRELVRQGEAIVAECRAGSVEEARASELQQELSLSLGALGKALKDTCSPFPVEGRPARLADRLIADVPPSAEYLVVTLEVAGSAISELGQLHGRAMAELAALAERAESSLGLEPLELPPEVDDDQAG